MRNKIVVPVDLTPASKNAFTFAVELAKKYDLGIEVFPMIDPELYVMNSLSEDFYGFKNKSMAQVVRDFLEADFLPESEFGVKVEISMIPNISVGLRKDVFMVVFGVETNNRYVAGVSVELALEMSESMSCDAVFVPEKGIFAEFKQMLFIANYDSAGISLLNKWKEIGESFDSKFNFIFDTGVYETNDSQKEVYGKLFEGGNPDFSFALSLNTQFEIEEMINEVVASRKIDLIILDTESASDPSKHQFIFQGLNQPILIPNMGGLVSSGFAAR